MITDRTAADVGAADKGSYNYTDLNRLHAACNELLELLRSVGYVVEMDTWHTWLPSDYPRVENTSAWLENIYRVINGFYKLNVYKLPDDMSAFTYEQANDIEKALLDIEQIIQNIKGNWETKANCIHSGYSVYGLRGYCL